MSRRAAVPLLSLAIVLSCQPVPPAPPPPTDTGADLPAFDPDAPALVFPPAPDRHARRALPRSLHGSGDDAEIGVAYPELDEQRKFEMSGQRLRIAINEPIAVELGVPLGTEVRVEPGTERAQAPLRIEPPVAGKIVADTHGFVFTADAPFDPEKEYALSLHGLKNAAGKHVLEGWSATFRADPEIWIGGKMLSYLPAVGTPRIVAYLPGDGGELGVKPRFTILFDQAVTPEQVRKLIGIEQPTLFGTRTIPTVLKSSGEAVFGGVAVPAGHVITMTARDRLKAGTELEVVRKDADVSEYMARTEFKVADKLGFTGVECWSSEACTWKAGKLALSGSSFTVGYTNALSASGKKLEQLVKVTPAVPNLSVWNDTWSTTGHLNISGGFAPSSHYEVEIAAVGDRFGQKTGKVSFSLDTAPLVASATMTEGAVGLTAERASAWSVVTRNVESVKVELWRVGDDAPAWDAAQLQVAQRERPGRAPDHTIEVKPEQKRDASITTTVDLSKELEPGRPYIAVLTAGKPAFGAAVPSYPTWSSAARAPTAMLTLYDEHALAVHTEAMPEALLVQVSRVKGGTPVAGASFTLAGVDLKGVTTDAEGIAMLPVAREALDKAVLHVDEGKSHAQVRLGRGGQQAGELAPQYAGEPREQGELRAMIVTDRGVYRPGSTVMLKGIARKLTGEELPALSGFPVKLRVTDPTGDDVFVARGFTNDAGSFSAQFPSEARAEIGRYTVSFEPMFGQVAPWTQSMVQIAEFEPPRFTVEVEAKADSEKLRAGVTGRYLFGAMMSGAQVGWTLRRGAATLPEGDIVGSGLSFEPERPGASIYGDYEYEYEGEEGERAPSEVEWSRSGETTLDAVGKLAIEQAIEMPKDQGPQRFVLEATVQDESHRAISARDQVIVYDAPRYAGVRIRSSSMDVGTEVPLDLAVADHDGNAVAGAQITAVLERVDWERTRSPASAGSWDERWHEVRREVARCKTESKRAATICAMKVDRSGDYVVTAYVDGRRGGSAVVWAWSAHDRSRPLRPGRSLELTADKKSYEPGDTAKLELGNPFGKALAILTIDGPTGTAVQQRTVSGPTETFEVALSAGHTPATFVTATLLPIDSDPAIALQWKYAALRLPVSGGQGGALEVAVKSDRAHYAPRDKATISVDVKQAGVAVANAEIALAVVDEGVLRLTDFHAPDPEKELHPAGGLWRHVVDNRDELATLGLKSHVAGDGGSEGDQSLVTTRKDFVQTALWRPDLRTDENGHVEVELPLPDNLTRFRMMAVVLDDAGRGGVKEDGFEVRKPLMVVPAVPRFATLGDEFEAAAVVHNGTAAQMHATVTLGDETREVDLPSGGHERVAFAMVAGEAGPKAIVFDAVSDDGERDRVEVTFPIHAPGIDERPRIAGAFVGGQNIRVEVPADAFGTEHGDDELLVTMGVALWPELGERVEFLVDYPHGCVEQTTSGTLPLLAAREILPRLGFVRFSQKEIDLRIRAGVDRLASMRTDSGGLAYWPGHFDPNPYGTAYAMRAIVRAEAAGIVLPKGLREGMVAYLVRELTTASSMYPGDLEVRAAMALALAEADALPAASADALFDTVPKQGVFGRATLALALSTLPNETKRVEELLDGIEKSIGTDGAVTEAAVNGDFAYYGSRERTRAQAALALQKLRPASTKLPAMIDTMVRTSAGSYTTQSTAFELITLAENLRSRTAEPVELSATLDGERIFADPIASVRIGPGALRFRVPLSRLRGRTANLELRASGDGAIGFLVESTWRRPFGSAAELAATSAKHGPDVYRMFVDPQGGDVDLAKVKPGQIVRVVLLARMPVDVGSDRLGYVALTDAIGGGFEPIAPDLATSATVPGLAEDHPVAQMLSWGAAEASHSELHDDRVDLYFDRVWGEWVAATYLVRATTPGTWLVAPAKAELMYEPDSVSYSDVAHVTVRP